MHSSQYGAQAETNISLRRSICQRETNIEPYITARNKVKPNSSIFTIEQPGFIPTKPRVNKKTEMDELNINEDTILSILKEFNISKSRGPDEISNILLMELSDVICQPLCTIVETLLKHLVFLMIWKVAKISAIYKMELKNSM